MVDISHLKQDYSLILHLLFWGGELKEYGSNSYLSATEIERSINAKKIWQF